MTEGSEAWVTLATNDSYALGALVLARSLRRVNTSRQLAVMVTPGVSGPMRGVLSDVFDVVSEVNILDSEDAANLALLARPELGITFTKIHCWKLTQYSKCVFLDADTLVIQNSDELFDREELSAAPDAGWPDCFNSGVFVFKPSLETYNHILTFALSNGSFDGGDQGLLNMYFNNWSQGDSGRRLPFIYNMCASATYSYLPAYRVFGQNVRIVHFIGQDKPWLIFFDTTTGLARPPSGQEHLQELLQGWWNIFRSEVHPRLSPEMGGGDLQSATMVEQVQSSFSQMFISAEPSASSQFSFQPPPQQSQVHSDNQSHTPSEHPQSHSHNEHNENTQQSEPPRPASPQFLVAIQRYPPEHFWTPPPVVYHPPPPRSPSPESSDCENNHSNSSPNPSQTDSQHHDSSSGTTPQGSNRSNSANDGSHNRGPNEQPSQRSDNHENKRKKRSKRKGIAGVYAKMAMEGDKSGEQLEYEDEMRKHAWEQGHIDYMGKDSFDNIMKRIQASMAQTSVQRPKSKSPTPQRKQTPPKQERVSQPPPAAEPEQTTQTESPPTSTTSAQQTAASTSEPKVEAKPVAEPSAPPVVPEPAPTSIPVTIPVTEKVPTPVSEPKVEAKATVAPTAAPVSETKVEVATTQPKTVPKTEPEKAEAQSAPDPEVTAAEKAQEEEQKALEERQALEKKLAEQKKAAEQKLLEEKQAAAARAEAAAAAAASAQSAPKSAPKAEPKAPPRKEKERGLGNAMQYGLGLLGAAVVVVFAIYAAYSPASLFL